MRKISALVFGITTPNASLIKMYCSCDNFTELVLPIQGNAKFMVKILVISDYRSTLSSRPEAEMFLAIHRIPGYTVDIMTYPEGEYVQKFRDAGMNVIPFHPTSKWKAAETKIIRKALLDGGHHMLHLYNSKAIIHGLRAARGLSVKTILYRGFAGHVHWYDPLAYTKYLHPRVDAIICITKLIQSDLERQLLFGKGKTVYIPKGHHPGWYDHVEKADLIQFEIPLHAFKVICVANNRSFKDIPTLLKSAHHISLDSNVHWLLVGEGMDSIEHKRIKENGPAASRIHLVGYRTDTLSLMKACDLVVLSSKGGEGLNKTVIEGLFLGKPAVVTNIPGHIDLVENQVNGLVVQPGNPLAFATAVQFLATHPEAYSLMASKARTFISSTLHIDQTVLKTLQLYSKLSMMG